MTGDSGKAKTTADLYHALSIRSLTSAKPTPASGLLSGRRPDLRPRYIHMGSFDHSKNHTQNHKSSGDIDDTGTCQLYEARGRRPAPSPNLTSFEFNRDRRQVENPTTDITTTPSRPLSEDGDHQKR